MKVSTEPFIVLDALTHDNARFADLDEAKAFARAQIPVSRTINHVPNDRHSLYTVWHAETQRVVAVVELSAL